MLHVRFPQVEGFLFENLQASTGPSAVTGVERFLERIAALREGNASGVEPEAGRAAIELLATRKVLDAEKEARLRSLLEVVRGGARPSEVVPAPVSDPRRDAVAEALVAWLHEWREVARLAISRRDHLISLGLASRRQPVGDAEDEEEATDDAEPKAPEPVSG